MAGPISGGNSGAASSISGLTTGQQVRAASPTTLESDGVKRYVALLSQSGTADPVATVFENTIGPIVWTRVELGDYEGALTDAFPAGKTWVMISGEGQFNWCSASAANVNAISYYTSIAKWEDQQSVATDNGGTVRIDIRVYP